MSNHIANHSQLNVDATVCCVDQTNRNIKRLQTEVLFISYCIGRNWLRRVPFNLSYI